MLDEDIEAQNYALELKPVGLEQRLRARSLQIAECLRILEPKSALSTLKFQKWRLEWL